MRLFALVKDLVLSQMEDNIQMHAEVIQEDHWFVKKVMGHGS